MVIYTQNVDYGESEFLSSLWERWEEHDGIWQRSRTLQHSSRMILFQMEMLNFLYINKFFLFAFSVTSIHLKVQKWQNTPESQWSLTRSLTTRLTLTLNDSFSIWFPFSMFIFVVVGANDWTMQTLSISLIRVFLLLQLFVDSLSAQSIPRRFSFSHESVEANRNVLQISFS